MPEAKNSARATPGLPGSAASLHEDVLPGEYVQAHGVVLVLSEPDLVIHQVSQNAASVIGKQAEALLGRPVETALGRAQRAVLEKTTRAAQGLIREHSLRFSLVVQGQRKQFNAVAHRRDGQLVLELEPLRALLDSEISRLLNQATAALAAVECEQDMQRLCKLAVDTVQEFTRYDRVMLYRIDEDGHGHVVAEARVPSCPLPSLLGKVLPARQQASPAGRGRRWREVRDLKGRLTVMMPQLNPLTGKRLSLRHGFLRSWPWSPWRRRLELQGVRGTMRIAVHIDGRHWGFIVCHHARPKSVPQAVRRVCSEFTHAWMQQMSVIGERARSERRNALATARDKLLAGMALGSSGHFAARLRDFEPELLAATGASGAALWWEGQLELYGRTHNPVFVGQLADWMVSQKPFVPNGPSRLPAYLTRALQEVCPLAANAGASGGMLAIPLGSSGCLMWFRPAPTLATLAMDYAVEPAEGARTPVLRAPSWTPEEIASAQGFMQLGWIAYQQSRAAPGSDTDLHTVMENLADGVIVCSPAGTPVIANVAAARMFELATDELLRRMGSGTLSCLRADGSALSPQDMPVQATLASGKPLADYRMGVRLADGTVRWMTVNCRRIKDGKSPWAGHVVMSLHDVSEQQRIERDLQALAHFDALTGLPNRALLKERCDQAIAQARSEDRRLGLVIVGLDRFKEINDTLGTAAGDQVLQEVARRLNLMLGDSITVARFGGDEFALLVDGREREEIAAAAARVRDALDTPARLDGNEIFIGCSVGVSVFPEDGDGREDLLKNADIAMNEAKSSGGNSVRMFSRELQARSSHELSIAAKLRRALERGELRIAYQPQVSLISNRVQGLEALMRWDSPELGAVPPAQFIRIAEETGLILPMGEWLLETACADWRSWQAAGLAPVRVAINLSARQFRDRQLAQKVAAALAATGMQARWLEFEITESVIMQDTQHNIETLEQLVSLGAKVAIDDFGTGYSSLAYLKRFPVHMLKIDRTFVRDISTDRDDAAIVRTIVGLAHSLELGVIAEGVETADQVNFLAQLNCDLYQGYYFSEPLPASEVAKLLQG